MKNLTQYISISILLLVFSCNNDFVTEKQETFLTSSSTIFISPNWEEREYKIYYQDIGTTHYTITYAPEWLNVSTTPSELNFSFQTGVFLNDYSSLYCKANVCNDLSKVGIYHTFMTLSVEGKEEQMIIPIQYVTEGNPVAEIPKLWTNRWDERYQIILPIKNTGEGVLLYSVSQYPEFLSIDYYSEYGSHTTAIPPNLLGTVFFSGLFPKKYSGKIIITTNDKNQPEVEMEIRGLDTFFLYVYNFINTLTFNRDDTTTTFWFSNEAEDELIEWKIEGCPVWLTVSDSQGILLPSQEKILRFTCNKERMPSGKNMATIYLKTNDKDYLSYEITVIAFND